MKTGFLFGGRPSTNCPVLYKSQERQKPSIMSESDTMFNERDRRCAAVQLILCTNQSTTHSLYHCQHPQNANPDWSTLQGTVQFIGRPFGGDGAEGHHQEDPDKWVHRKAIIDENPQRPIEQNAWDLGISHTTVNACVKEDLRCRSYRRLTSQILTDKTKKSRLIKSFRPPPPLTWTHWTTSFGHSSRTSPTWPPTTPRSAWSPPSTEYSPISRRRLWKKYAPSSGSVSRWGLRLKATTLNRCQLYYIIKLPDLIFSIKC